MTIADKYQFFLDHPNAGSSEAHPINGSLSWTWNKEEGKRYFRKDLATKLVFIDSTADNLQEFTPWYLLERYKDRCAIVRLLVQPECGEGYQAQATVMDADFDADRCRVDVKFGPDDAYACIHDNWERERNILQLTQPQTVNLFEGSIELSQTCISSVVANATELTRFSQTEVTNCIEQNEGWVLWKQFYSWVSAGDPNNPDLGTWSLQTQWIRERVHDVTEPDSYGWLPVAAGGWARPVPVRLEFENIGYGIIQKQYQIAIPADIGIDNGRLLNDVILYFFSEFCGQQVVSNFFGINPDGTEPDNDAYTKAKAVLQEVMIFHKGDIVRHDADENNIFLNMSLKKLLETLQEVFNVEYRIRDDKIYLEHYSYFLPNKRLDLTQEQWLDCLKDTFKWTYDKESLPSKEEYFWQDQTNMGENPSFDFDGLPIVYSEGCNAGQDSKQHRAENVTTNIEAMILDGNPENWTITSESYVLVATIGGQVVREVGAISGEVHLNATLAWANLHESFHKDGRYFQYGRMNGQNTEFNSVVKIRKQVPIRIPMCCSDLQNFDPELLIVKTQLGHGEIDSATYDEPSGYLTLNLVFP